MSWRSGHSAARVRPRPPWARTFSTLQPSRGTEDGTLFQGSCLKRLLLPEMSPRRSGVHEAIFIQVIVR